MTPELIAQPSHLSPTQARLKYRLLVGAPSLPADAKIASPPPLTTFIVARIRVYSACSWLILSAGHRLQPFPPRAKLPFRRQAQP